MQPTPLSQLPLLLRLRSDQIFYRLAERLALGTARTGVGQWNGADGWLQRATNAYRPDHFRKEDIRRAHALLTEGSPATLDYRFDFLCEWFAHHMELDDATLAIRPGCEALCGPLFGKLHPYTLVGYHLARRWQRRHLTTQLLQTLAEGVTPLLFRVPLGHLTYAENHLHISGAQEAGTTMMRLLVQPATPAEYYSPHFVERLPHLPEFELLNGGLLTIGRLLDITKWAYHHLITMALNGQGAPGSLLKLQRLWRGERLHALPPRPLALETLQRLAALSPTAASGIAAAHPLLRLHLHALAAGRYNRGLFHLAVYLHWLHHHIDSQAVKDCAKLVLHGINILRATMVMGRNAGLSHFVDFYESPTRNGIDDPEDIADTLLLTGTTLIEGKVSPKAVLRGDHLRLGLALDATIGRLLRLRSTRASPMEERFLLACGWQHGTGDMAPPVWRYHFVVHFIREPDTDTFTTAGRVAARFTRLRARLAEQARRLDDYLKSPGTLTVPALMHYLRHGVVQLRDAQFWSELRQRRLNLAALIVGVDVAGRECDTPPEVFAPAIHFLRDSRRSPAQTGNIPHVTFDDAVANAVGYRPPPRLRVMVHAGEDFFHLLTGLRRIDETVLFYGLAPGDRLGHALALGIAPEQWLSRSGEVFVTAGEHLDNLVWLHHQLLGLAPLFGDAATFLPGYEEEIARLGEWLYGTPCTPYRLHQAWRLRSNDPERFFDPRYRALAAVDPWIGAALNHLPDQGAAVGRTRETDAIPTATELYHRYHYCPEYRRREATVITLRHRRDVGACGRQDAASGPPIRRSIDDSELRLWSALQDHLISRYCALGLVVEANPSSNLTIARLEHMGEHPIFRFDPPDPMALREGGGANRFGLRSGVMPTCVNSDDPTIMLTTLPNEFLLLKSAAITYHGCAPSAAEAWVDRLRLFGERLFCENHRPVVSRSKWEVSGI